MTLNTRTADPEFNALFRGLEELERSLAASGVNKHDRAHMLISASIAGGIENGPQITGVLARLGFNRRHAGMILQDGVQPAPEWPNWGRRESGNYYAPPRPEDV